MLRRLRQHWQSFRRLTRAERWWLAQGLLLLSLTAAALRWFGLQRLQAILARPAPPSVGQSESADITKPQMIAWILEIAGRQGFCRATCLHRSLALWWWLRRLGIESDLRIGFRRNSGIFEAHAWVECQGVVLNDAADIHQQFVAFDGDILSAEGRLL